MIKPQTSQNQRQTQYILMGGGLLILILLAVHHLFWNFGTFPDALYIHLRDPIDAFKSWVIGNRNTHPLFTFFFEPFSDTIDFSLRRIEDVLLWLPWSVIVLGIFLLAQKVADLRVALLSVVGLLFMGFVGLWDESMETLTLVLVSVLISLMIGIPLGVLAARYEPFEKFMRPILDAMQTMPAFVYLIPVLLFFGVARVPSVVATMIYAIPPAIRLTTLGIRQVPPEIIEAARAFGSTPRQILFKVQLPLATPTIMAGVNQTIMMALSIVVIAALIGAGGLGEVVLNALRGLKVGIALEAGLAIVFLAVLLDRISYAFSQTDQDSPANKKVARLFPETMVRYTLIWHIERVLEQGYQLGGRIAQSLTNGLAWLSRPFFQGLGFVWSHIINLLHTLTKSISQPLGAFFEEMKNSFEAKQAGHNGADFVRRHPYFFSSIIILCLLLIPTFLLGQTEFPDAWRVDIYKPVDAAVIWMRDNLYEQQVGGVSIGTGPLSDTLIIYFLKPLNTFLEDTLAWPVIILSVAILGMAVSGWRLAFFTGFITFCMGLLGMWELALDTLSQVIVAVILSLLIALPLGILAARSDLANNILRPILDTLQTIPSFVYLVPVVMLFNVGRMPGIIASVLYALPPAIRLTSLGIRRADPHAVEAAHAFGSTDMQTLLKVQLPLALPSIMIGVNQTIMMVLAMVVIAGMVGGAGLGLEAVNGLAKSQVGQGIEAGLAIVILAIVIDRLMNAWADRLKVG